MKQNHCRQCGTTKIVQTLNFVSLKKVELIQLIKKIVKEENDTGAKRSLIEEDTGKQRIAQR